MLLLFLKGIIIGFAIAAPVGPIAILCIQRTLSHGRLTGFCIGMGAASADMIYACIAGFGLVFITSFLILHQTWLRFIGSIFLLYLGYKVSRSKPAAWLPENKQTNLVKIYGFSFMLTLTNPLTIFAFMAIFTSFGIVSQHEHYSFTILLISGVFIGSFLWWLILVWSVSLFRSRIKPSSFRWINLCAGSIIVLFGAGTLASSLL